MRRRISRRGRAAAAEEPQVNMTPLIDVVFVILIMFIVVAPLLELDQVDLAEAPTIQTEGSATVQEASPVRIHVKKDNAILINNQKTTISQLPAQLAQAKNRNPHARPQIFHDKEAYFGTYQSVKNAVEAAGFEQMDIILKPAP